MPRETRVAPADLYPTLAALDILVQKKFPYRALFHCRCPSPFSLYMSHSPATWAGSRAGSPVSYYVPLVRPLRVVRDHTYRYACTLVKIHPNLRTLTLFIQTGCKNQGRPLPGLEFKPLINSGVTN
jgi:hypothetical protein